jgi:hypothetical protein
VAKGGVNHNSSSRVVIVIWVAIDKNPFAYSNLRSCKPDSWSLVHAVEKILD